MTTTISIQQRSNYLEHLSEQEKKVFISSDSVSDNNNTILGNSELTFTSVKSLYINTQGIGLLRLPLPPSKLEITVHNYDGTIAYRSTRAKRSSGNCVLTDADNTSLIKTTYCFGPCKDPVLSFDVFHDTEHNIKTISKWTSRSHSFLLPDGRTFTWKYTKEKGFGTKGAKGTALILKLGDKRIAALIRNQDTRTPGSKPCSAGNGGELVLSEDANKKDGLSEELIVATCLLMLKKEIDRRRAVQFMIISGAVS
jgi:hypothetical protein